MRGLGSVRLLAQDVCSGKVRGTVNSLTKAQQRRERSLEVVNKSYLPVTITIS